MALGVSRFLLTILHHLCISSYSGLSVTSYPIVATSSIIYFFHVLHYIEGLFGSCSMQSRYAHEVLLQLCSSVCCNIGSCYMPYAMTHFNVKHTLRWWGNLGGSRWVWARASNSVSHEKCTVLICLNL